MMYDEWESCDKIANSFDDFINNLKVIDKLINEEHQDVVTLRKFVEKLDVDNDANGFYEDLCYDVLEEK